MTRKESVSLDREIDVLIAELYGFNSIEREEILGVP